MMGRRSEWWGEALELLGGRRGDIDLPPNRNNPSR